MREQRRRETPCETAVFEEREDYLREFRSGSSLARNASPIHPRGDGQTTPDKSIDAFERADIDRDLDDKCASLSELRARGRKQERKKEILLDNQIENEKRKCIAKRVEKSTWSSEK